MASSDNEADADNAKTRVFTLVRLFDKLEYAESFRAGNLRMQRVAYFRKYRDANGELRGDKHEGVAAIYQPKDLGTIKFGDLEIPASDLAGPILLYPEREQTSSILCMWALTNAGFETASFESLTEMKAAIALHQQMYGLGEHLVYFRNAEKFVKRVDAAARASGYGIARRLVSYYNPETFSGAFPPETVPFQKRQMYSHQREYRIVLYTDNDAPQPYVLNVGDLSDIAEIALTREFNEQLTLEERSGS